LDEQDLFSLSSFALSDDEFRNAFEGKLLQQLKETLEWIAEEIARYNDLISELDEEEEELTQLRPTKFRLERLAQISEERNTLREDRTIYIQDHRDFIGYLWALSTPRWSMVTDDLFDLDLIEKITDERQERLVKREEDIRRRTEQYKTQTGHHQSRVAQRGRPNDRSQPISEAMIADLAAGWITTAELKNLRSSELVRRYAGDRKTNPHHETMTRARRLALAMFEQRGGAEDSANSVIEFPHPKKSDDSVS
jgi:hypothetical protein